MGLTRCYKTAVFTLILTIASVSPQLYAANDDNYDADSKWHCESHSYVEQPHVARWRHLANIA